MSIEKYLETIECRERHPGPISVKLKYEIKNRLIKRQKRKQQIYFTVSCLGITMFLFAAVLLYKPDYAVSIHNSIAANTEISETVTEVEIASSGKTQRDVPLQDGGMILGSQALEYNVRSHSSFRQISSDSQPSSAYQVMELSHLEEDKPYIIRKVRGQNDRFIYFVNEIQTNGNNRRLPY